METEISVRVDPYEVLDNMRERERAGGRICRGR